ncbi:PTS galactosamine/N-acetylgalactosamine transporter subunit IIA [Wukongibacter sp. M2B1]|uniref:PTS galactosamine/N-acetylgalactosamine transporter subunit IIA n=1 Tax=Wukongibacter sp. M2B1 TaxID=3088895 RepID=UPI003D78E1CA
MIGIIVSGHGGFATGLKSVIELVVGNQENFEVVDFLESHSTENLKNNLKLAMDKMDVEGYIFFTDIPGGSPFKQSVELSLEHGNSEVIAGSNIPMIIEILFDRYDNNPKELIEKAIKIGKEQIVSFSMKNKSKKVEEVDGI